jgi:hypothetical protein
MLREECELFAQGFAALKRELKAEIAGGGDLVEYNTIELARIDAHAQRYDLFGEYLEPEADGPVRHCPWCSAVLPADTSNLPHNPDGQPYCSGRCFDKDMRSAGLEEV